jgi:hypothetical protein
MVPSPGPEALARRKIDAQLTQAGWLVQSRDEVNLSAGRGVAVREVRMEKGYGYADYLLFLDGKALGAFEAKKSGVALTGIELQAKKYLPQSRPEGRWRSYPLEELVQRDKVSLDLFWLRDESLEDSATLPDPDVLAEEIAEDLRSSLEQIEGILGDLRQRVGPRI